MVAGLLLVLPLIVTAADGQPPQVAPAKALAAALSERKWEEVQRSVDRGLGWLASQQAENGSFPSLEVGQPAVTSLCIMAFLSRGVQPGYGPSGRQLNRAIDYVLSCQLEDGLISRLAPGPGFELGSPSQTASYDHAISGLMLGEVYGHVTGQRARNIKRAIDRAIAYTRKLQSRPKVHRSDIGGWRYVRLRGNGNEADADMSITAWHLMFLRSARNAEFKVPREYMTEAVEYIKRCYEPSSQMFNYTAAASNAGNDASRGTTGAAIVSLSMAGEHDSPMARAAGNWLAEHPFGPPYQLYGPYDRFYYSAYYCGQAAAQLGGRYWERIYPPLAQALLNLQGADGSFPLEPKGDDSEFGQCYTTAMAILALTPAYQILPVYQR